MATDDRLLDLGWRLRTFPLTILSRVLTGTLIAGAVEMGLVIHALAAHLADVRDAASLYGSTDAGDIASSTTSTEYDLSYAVIIAGFLFTASAVAFGVWLYRARRNVEVYGAAHQRLRPGWAVGGWFVPVLNVVIPVRVVLDVLRDSVRPVRARDYAAVAVWWLAWLGQWTAYLAARHRTELHGGPALLTVACVASAVAAVSLAYLIRRISAGQALLEARL